MHLYLRNGVNDPESPKQTLLSTPIWLYYCAFFHLIIYTELVFSVKSFLSPVSMKEQSLCPFSELTLIHFPTCRDISASFFPMPCVTVEGALCLKFSRSLLSTSFPGLALLHPCKLFIHLPHFLVKQPALSWAMQMARNSEVLFVLHNFVFVKFPFDCNSAFYSSAEVFSLLHVIPQIETLTIWFLRLNSSLSLASYDVLQCLSLVSSLWTYSVHHYL